MSISFKVTHGKNLISVSISSESTLKDLKTYLEQWTGVPVKMQKLFFKGLLKNEDILLKTLGLKESTKIMLVGSTANDISQTSSIRSYEEEKNQFSLLNSLTPAQQRIVEKGLPEDRLLLDSFGDIVPDTIPGLYNEKGLTIRMHIKKEADEILIISFSHIKRIFFSSISDISSVPITSHNGYCVLVLHLGPRASYSIYFFPQQFVNSLRTIVCPFYIENFNLF